ncbi:SMI1/KNR4 family protein [Streptobacillus canis]|uniref:SMI1/KNR4 family protein n=1 Tax=Streptobacillus canis TaxID=2678686 RepID=UPI0012E30071|nr:SMI1/KNR4 family protein [Streptobacillus canis]
MFEKILKEVKENNIELLPPVSDEDIEKIEKIYNFRMPKCLKNLYKEGMPLNEYTINYADFSIENVNKIKEYIKYYDEEWNMNRLNWPDSLWGPEPEDEDERYDEMERRFNEAEGLIPLTYKGYFISQVVDSDKTPVFHVACSDVIILDASISSFIKRFFIEKKLIDDNKEDDLSFKNQTFVKFWLEICYY